MAYRLFKEDCLERLKEIPAHSVDLILTDPPYGTTTDGVCGRNIGGEKRPWDCVTPFAPMWDELKRIIKRRRVILLFSGQPFTTALISSEPTWYHYTMYWIKNNATMASIGKQPMRKVEEINAFYDLSDNRGEFHQTRAYLQKERAATGLTTKEITRLLGNNMASHYFTDGKQFGIPSRESYERLQETGRFCMAYDDLRALYESEKPDNDIAFYPQKQYFNGKYPHNALFFDNESQGNRNRLHPSQKPVKLLEYLIKTYTKPGETVLDFTMGSASTGVAALNTGRDFIGIERDAEYYETARRRMKEAAARGEAVTLCDL